MKRIISAVLRASKVIDFQFHLFVIPSLGQSPFTLLIQSCSSLKTTSMVFGEGNLSIKKSNFLIWIWAKFLYPNYFSSLSQKKKSSPLVLLQLLFYHVMFHISPVHSKDKRLHKYVWERCIYLFLGLEISMECHKQGIINEILILVWMSVLF